MIAPVSNVRRARGALSSRGASVELAEADLESLYGGDADEEGLAARSLTPFERENYLELGWRRRREWLAGRLVAKALVSEHAGGLALEAIEICSNEMGAPRVRYLGEISAPPPEVSISHSHGRVVAALLPGGLKVRLGIDVERVARRSEAFVKRVLGERELARVWASSQGPEAEVALCWSLKEAACKALGLGLPQLMPWHVEAAPLGQAGAFSLTLLGPALDRFHQLGALTIEGHGAVADGFSLAEVVLTTG